MIVAQDSGGFQLVSLSKFTTITEEGALFLSPFTGEPTMLTVSVYTACLGCRLDIPRSRKKVYQFNIPLVQI